MSITMKRELTSEEVEMLENFRKNVTIPHLAPGTKMEFTPPILPETIGESGQRVLADMVKKMEQSGRELSERESFMLEAATQHGFDFIDDDINVLAVDAETLVDFLSKWRSPDERTIDDLGINEWIDQEINNNELSASFPYDGPVILASDAAELAREAALRVIFDKAALITNLANDVHQSNVMAGWWNDLKTGEDLHGKRNVGELLCLMHSELSEAMEGHRKGLMDDKLPHRPMFRVELIDCLIRILDTLGADQNRPHEHPAGVIFCEKRNYNNTRADHKPENRLTQHGKRF